MLTPARGSELKKVQWVSSPGTESVFTVVVGAWGSSWWFGCSQALMEAFVAL